MVVVVVVVGVGVGVGVGVAVVVAVVVVAVAVAVVVVAPKPSHYHQCQVSPKSSNRLFRSAVPLARPVVVRLSDSNLATAPKYGLRFRV